MRQRRCTRHLETGHSQLQDRSLTGNVPSLGPCSAWKYTTNIFWNMDRHTFGDDRGWDGWRASPTQWTLVWVNSGSWWWTGRPGVLWSMGSRRVGHDWATEPNWKYGSFQAQQEWWNKPPPCFYPVVDISTDLMELSQGCWEEEIKDMGRVTPVSTGVGWHGCQPRGETCLEIIMVHPAAL